MATLLFDALAACAPAAYHANADRHGVYSEAALGLTELKRLSPGFSPATQGQLQEEPERQATALEEDIRHLHMLLADGCKRAIEDFWRPDAQAIVQYWRAVTGRHRGRSSRPVGSLESRTPKRSWGRRMM